MRTFQRLGLFSEIVFTLLIGISESMAKNKLPEQMIRMKVVKDKIFKGYDKDLPPRVNGSDTTDIKTLFAPKLIIDFDEEKSRFILDSFLYMSWEDPRLKWNLTTEYSSPYMKLPSDLLWIPRITVQNSYIPYAPPTVSQKILTKVKHTGLVTWYSSVQTHTVCSLLSESAYPYGAVKCFVGMGFSMLNDWNVEFSHRNEFNLSNFENNNSRWELLVSETRFRQKEQYYANNTVFYLTLNAYFSLRRRPLPEIEATRNPCILIMILTLSIFWLPPKSSTKILLGGILFLLLTVMLVYVACSTHYQLRVTAAVSHLQTAMYILVATLLLQIFIIFKLCALSDSVRPPVSVMKLLTSSFGTYTCLRWPCGYNMPMDQIQPKERPFGCLNSQNPQHEWMLVATAVDKFFFVLMFIAMITVLHS